jgi:hypothetical protein
VQLNGPHGVISQKMILFINTAVKTSNPTERCIYTVTRQPTHVDPDDGGSIYLRNIGNIAHNHTDYKFFASVKVE